jgi:hypothetical protein
LASKKEKPVPFSHIEKTLNANKKFIIEFNGEVGGDFGCYL